MLYVIIIYTIMNKFLTILLALLISPAVFAAETVLKVNSSLPDMSFGVFGTLDIGAHYADRNIDPNTGKRLALDSSLQKPSQIGLRAGTKIYEDLKTGIVLDRSLRSDTGTEGNGFDRQAFWYIASDKYGKLSLGRQYSSTYLAAIAFDPFADNIIGDIRVAYKFLIRTDNTLSYTSPDFGGLYFMTGYTFSAVSDERNANDGDISLAFFTPFYKNGNFKTALSLQYYSMDSENVFAADAFASYDFGLFKLTGAYGRHIASEADFTVYGSEGKNTEQLIGALTMPLWKNCLLTTFYAHRSTSVAVGGEPPAKINQYSLGLTQTLSKNLNLYLIYTSIINNSTARDSLLSGGRLGSAIHPNAAPGINSGYQSGLALGINFAFDLNLEVSSK